MTEELEQRLIDLEIRYSFIEEQVEELNQIVTSCNLQIDRLQKENLALREMLKSLSPSLEESPDE